MKQRLDVVSAMWAATYDAWAMGHASVTRLCGGRRLAHDRPLGLTFAESALGGSETARNYKV